VSATGAVPRFVHTLALIHHDPNPISTFQAIVLGVLQGATELFPVSSLGGERFRRRAEVRELAAREGMKADGGRRLDTLEFERLA
jgi:hypothetical protein